MTSFKDLVCSKPALYVFQGALAAGTVALETVSCVAIDKAITSAYEFGQYCNLQSSSTIIPQLSNITCQVLKTSDYYYLSLDTLLGTSALIAAGTLGGTFIIKNSSAKNEEREKLLNSQDTNKNTRLPLITGTVAAIIGSVSYIANRIFSSGAHNAAQLAGQCCSAANTTLTNPTCAHILCETVQNSESLNLTGRIVTTAFVCLSITGFVASSVFCKCKQASVMQESDFYID